jgi:hypothetical protein
VYQRRDGTDVAAVVLSVDVSIWPPSYALKETQSGAMLDTNPGRLWPPAARAVLKADAAMDELLEEEEEAGGAAGGGKGGKKGKAAKGKSGGKA